MFLERDVQVVRTVVGKGETKKELDLLSDSKRRFVIEYFKESYDVLGIDYKHKQEQLELK